MISFARRVPTARGKYWVEPRPGMMPSVVSVNAKRAVLEPHAKSQARTSSIPPPKAAPFTAPISGKGQSMIASAALSNTACCRLHCASVMPFLSLRSAPAQKARSPAPVNTTQRRPPVSFMIFRKRSRNSPPITVFIALATCGLFITTRKTSWSLEIASASKLIS